MTEIIRIPNIENYIQEIINGELVLTPKNLKNTSDDAFINEQIARQMVLEYYFHGRTLKEYELEIYKLANDDECRAFLNREDDEDRELLKRQVGMIHQIRLMIYKKFVERFGEKLWNDLRLEYGYAGC
jgi:hypothetical protein